MSEIHESTEKMLTNDFISSFNRPTCIPVPKASFRENNEDQKCDTSSDFSRTPTVAFNDSTADVWRPLVTDLMAEERL